MCAVACAGCPNRARPYFAAAQLHRWCTRSAIATTHSLATGQIEREREKRSWPEIYTMVRLASSSAMAVGLLLLLALALATPTNGERLARGKAAHTHRSPVAHTVALRCRTREWERVDRRVVIG